MLKKTKICFVLFLLFFIIGYANNQSTGAPESSTGAPSERTCASSNCHDDNILNFKNGKIDLVFESNNTSESKIVNGVILSDNVYNLNISINQKKIERFGFQLVALNDSGESVGNFILMDSNRTQLQKGLDKFINRQYVTYTYLGTIADSVGYKSWDLKWHSPKSIKGSIKFYLACLSGNKDLTDKGDYVYTMTRNFTMVDVICEINENDNKNLLLNLK